MLTLCNRKTKVAHYQPVGRPQARPKSRALTFLLHCHTLAEYNPAQWDNQHKLIEKILATPQER